MLDTRFRGYDNCIQCPLIVSLIRAAKMLLSTTRPRA